MNAFFEWMFIFLCFFLFWGEPDVWDKAHDYVMHNLEVNKTCEKQY